MNVVLYYKIFELGERDDANCVTSHLYCLGYYELIIRKSNDEKWKI